MEGSGATLAERARTGSIRLAVTHRADPDAAVAELADGLSTDDPSLLLFFCSATSDLRRLGPALRQRWPGAGIAGCTTTREITPSGYAANSIVGISLAEPDFFAVTRRIDDLRTFGIERGQKLVADALDELSDRAQKARRPVNTFAMLLIDGVSCCEETVVSSLQSVLGHIPLLGGSAGDDLAFERSWVLHGDGFHERSAVLVLVATHHPFEVFKTEHFVGSETRLVVTAAAPDLRIVHAINGRPAAAEYARLTGLEPHELTPAVFAANPLVVRSGGGNYVRSIQQVNPDGSLTFMCAIDEGLVLRMARNIGIIEDLERRLSELRQRLGSLQLVIGCECILRYLELQQKRLTERSGRILSENNVVGFCTYGEQFKSMHINQTFTGVAIARFDPDDDRAV
ncbi:nitric oxide-sensing protein NosP [Azospirillum halopraeferens]|uniref:nitric oxide-sensing protein NosP n=1 Tax=Azospirillum halopraeferens TaxID=34010 RepID=UPI000413FD6C|nr:nitric oxide-sensing protein NosP [Azospirillum halopraeferens]